MVICAGVVHHQLAPISRGLVAENLTRGQGQRELSWMADRSHSAAGRGARAALLLLGALGCSGAHEATRGTPTGAPAPAVATDHRALLHSAKAALAGSQHSLDLRGNPARAWADAKRAEAAAGQRRDLEGVSAARRLQAFSAGAGGDYATAVRLGLELLAAEGSDAELSAAVWSWERLRLSSGTAAFSFIADYSTQFPEQLAPKTPRSTPSLRFALANYSTMDGTISTSPLDPPMLLQVASLAVSNVKPEACDQSPCAFGALLAARLYFAAGAMPEARGALKEAASLAKGKSDVLGAVALMEGDLNAAPHGDVFDLNLASLRLSRTVLELNAGLPPVAFEAVARADLERAQAAYARAAELFTKGSLPRGTAQLRVRSAYVSFAKGDAAGAANAFGQAARSFRGLGDVHLALRADLARVVCLLASDDFETAKQDFSSWSEELAERRGVGLAHSGVLFFRTFARWSDAHGDTRGSLEALRLAARLAKASDLPYEHHEIEAELADAAAALGQRADALNSWISAQASLDTFVARVRSRAPASGPFNRDDQLSNVAWQRAHLKQAIIRDSLALRDYESAHVHNEELKRMAADIAAPQVRQKLAHAIAENDSSLMLNGVVPAKDLTPIARALLAIRNGNRTTATAALAALRQQVLAGLKALPRAKNSLEVQQVKQDLELAIAMQVLAGDIAAAEQLFVAGENVGKGWLFSDPRKPWDSLRYRALFAQRGQRNDKADQLFRQAIESVERQASVAGGLQERRTFFEETTAPFESYARFLLMSQRPIPALAILERSRARTFQAQLELANTFESDSPKGRLVARWTAGHAELAGLSRSLASTSDGAGRTELQTLIERKRGALDKVEAEMAAAGIALPVGAGTLDGAELIRKLTAALDPRVPTTILVYGALDDEVWVWVLDDSGLVAAQKLPLTVTQLRRQARALMNQVLPGATATVEARALFDALLAPVLARVPPPIGNVRSRLGVLTPARLPQIPFHALLGKRGHVIEDHDVFYLPSLQGYVSAVTSSGLREHSKVVRAIAPEEPPLARQEALAVTKPGNAAMLEQATKNAIMAAAAAPGILLIASHGRLNPLSPFLSNLELSQGEKLYGHEILGMDAKSWLVTLSACNSGVSAASSSGEVTSMGGAFLAAGVPAVVSAGWVTSDQTTLETMKVFYARLAEGVASATALGDAQRQALASGAMPLYWSPLFLAGSDR
jgi:CHAT domain-containing protein